MKPNQNESGDSKVESAEFEDVVMQALVAAGQAFPQTPEQVVREKQRQALESDDEADAPPSAATILAMIKGEVRPEVTNIVPFPSSDSSDVKTELARAARNGRELPPEIEKKLAENRQKKIAESRGNSE